MVAAGGNSIADVGMDPFGLGGKITGPGGYKHVPYYFARILPIIAEEKLLPQIDPDGKLTDEQKELARRFIIKHGGQDILEMLDL